MAETVLPAKFNLVKNPLGILELETGDLHTLISAAIPEMREIEGMFETVAQTLAQVHEDSKLLEGLQNYRIWKEFLPVKLRKRQNIHDGFNAKESPGAFACLSVGMILMFVGGSISPFLGMVGIGIGLFSFFLYFKQSKSRQAKLKKDIERRRAEADETYKKAQTLIDTAKSVHLIPKDYRHTLALTTMLKYLENGRAQNWKELADKYELQVHQWTLEKNSQESLEYQKFAALQAELTAENTRKTATATSISAVIDIARLFG